MTTHRMSGSSEYTAWSELKKRCLNKKCKNYSGYGGRGITVCDRWKNSFESFYKDMGPKPSPKHSIDRIDNNKGYFPENCRWATLAEQAKNTRRNIYIFYKNERKTLDEWAKIVGIKCETLRSRLFDKRWSSKWTVSQAMEIPPNSGNRYKRSNLVTS